MSMPMTSDMSMTSAMAMDTRHLEVHVFFAGDWEGRHHGPVRHHGDQQRNQEAHVRSGRHQGSRYFRGLGVTAIPCSACR